MIISKFCGYITSQGSPDRKLSLSLYNLSRPRQRGRSSCLSRGMLCLSLLFTDAFRRIPLILILNSSWLPYLTRNTPGCWNTHREPQAIEERERERERLRTFRNPGRNHLSTYDICNHLSSSYTHPSPHASNGSHEYQACRFWRVYLTCCSAQQGRRYLGPMQIRMQRWRLGFTFLVSAMRKATQSTEKRKMQSWDLLLMAQTLNPHRHIWMQ